jgi:hypothetical protein
MANSTGKGSNLARTEDKSRKLINQEELKGESANKIRKSDI